MKRCPECQFLYENESTCCDMDGTPLRYTVALPSIPGLAKSIWDRWTIALLLAVVIGTVLVILYRATPRAYTSSAPLQMNSINQEMPPTKQEVAPSETAAETSATEENVDASATSDGTRDPFESQSTTAATKVPRSKGGSPLADEKEAAPAPVIHFEAASSLPAAGTIKTGAKPTTETVAAEKSATQTESQNAASATSTSAHPTPPATYSNKPATPDQKKDSGLKSFFKKAGRVLKKPFDDK